VFAAVWPGLDARRIMAVQSPSPSHDAEAASSARPTLASRHIGDMELVREQLGPVLGTAPFRNSKRFPAFLPHAVEHALSCAVGLIERTIGHDVFGVIPVTTPRRIQLCE
jgi:hypothetical protein